MKHELLDAAEELVTEYAGRVPATTVIHVLHDIDEAQPGQSAAGLEERARARLEQWTTESPEE